MALAATRYIEGFIGHDGSRIPFEGGLITEIEKINDSQEGAMDGSSGWPADP